MLEKKKWKKKKAHNTLSPLVPVGVWVLAPVRPPPGTWCDLCARSLSLSLSPLCREKRVVFWMSGDNKEREREREVHLDSLAPPSPPSLLPLPHLLESQKERFRDTHISTHARARTHSLSGWWQYKSNCRQGVSKDARLGKREADGGRKDGEFEGVRYMRVIFTWVCTNIWMIHWCPGFSVYTCTRSHLYQCWNCPQECLLKTLLPPSSMWGSSFNEVEVMSSLSGHLGAKRAGVVVVVRWVIF